MDNIISNEEIQALSSKIRAMNQELKNSFSRLETQVKEKVKEVVFLKEYTERVLMSVPDPIIIFSADLKIEYVNFAFEELVSLDADDLMGKTLDEADLKFKAQWESAIKGLLAYSQGAEAHASEQSLPQYHPKDPLAPESAAEEASPLRNIMHFGERLFGYMFFDVAAELKIDRRIGFLMRELTHVRLLRDQLAETERLAGLGRLVAGIGHELNNPLFAIIGYSESLLEQKDTKKIQKGAARILDRAQHMSGIIKNFSGDMADGGTHVSKVDINEIIETAIRKTLKNFPSGKIQLEKRFNDLSFIKADFNEMTEIFSHIILNALQAMEGEGTLTMISDQVDGKIVVKIKDTGPGIPEEYLSKIFEPYFTTKAQGDGNGMGLNIAYRAVKKYGGQITVDSPESEGTTFTVIL